MEELTQCLQLLKAKLCVRLSTVLQQIVMLGPGRIAKLSPEVQW